MSTGTADAFWIPESLDFRRGDDSCCRWVDAAGIRYTDPFFETTLARSRRGGRKVSSSLQHLYDRASAAAPVEPVFIFHVSRCGSTLLSQLFGLDEQAIVLSEVPLLDAILQSGRHDSDALFDATLRLLGNGRDGIDQRLFVKTDCWHLFHARTLRRIYPRAPFVLLYRSPAAVLASHRRARGSHMVPGLVPAAQGRLSYEPARMSLDQYAVSVLERYYRAMIDIAAGGRALLVNYGEGFPDAFLRASRWLELRPGDEQMRRVRARCGYHAKRPQEAFEADPAASLPDVDLSMLESLFAELEERRG